MAAATFSRARNCTTRRAGHGVPRATSTPHAVSHGDLAAQRQGAGGRGMDSSRHLLASAELYDPASGTWTATGSLNTARNGSHGDLAAQRQGARGRRVNATLLASAELYDPAIGTWSATGNLTIRRSGHTATLLPNGKVLVAGGDVAVPHLPARNCTTRRAGPGVPRAASTPARTRHTATLLPNGQVLVAGGRGMTGILASAELYDPVLGNWIATGSLATPSETHHTATLLPGGQVLVAGGPGPVALLRVRNSTIRPTPTPTASHHNLSTFQPGSRLELETMF